MMLRSLTPSLGLSSLCIAALLGARGVCPESFSDGSAVKGGSQEREGDGKQDGDGDKTRDREEVKFKAAWKPTPPESEDEVAFWIWLEGSGASPIAVTLEEWNRYFEELYRVYPVEDHTSMAYRIFQGILDAKVLQLKYYEQVPAVLEKCEEIVRKMERGMTWERAVRLYTADASSKMDGGLQGPYKRQLQRYPLETGIFCLEDGEVSGPFLTKYGAEFFRCEHHSEERNNTQEYVVVSYLVLKFGEGIGKMEWPQIRRKLRLSTQNEFFLNFLPPGMMNETPAHFGPNDVAPVGQPNLQLQTLLTGPPIVKKSAAPKESASSESSGG